MVKKILFVTGHSFSEKSRVSVHLLAKAAALTGNTVRIFVCGVGPTYVFKDRGLLAQADGVWKSVSEVEEYSKFNIFAPVDLRSPLLNSLATSWFSQYGASFPDEIAQQVLISDLVILESGVAVPYLKALDRLGALTKTVYLAADDVKTVRGHPIIARCLEALGGKVRGVLSFGAHRGDPLFNSVKSVFVDKGIDLDVYENCHQSPYIDGTKNIICVGNMLFDSRVVEVAKSIEGVNFHFIGNIPSIDAGNLHFYGVMPFEETVGFVKFADAGLMPYRRADGMRYLATSSLKFAQFRACGLPVVGPADLEANYAAFFPYEIFDQQAFRNAVLSAVEFENSGFGGATSYKSNWDVLSRNFLEI